MKRVILIVLDSVGIGELPDAALYGDAGSNTLGNIAKSIPDFDLPNLRTLGLGNIAGLSCFEPVRAPSGAFGRAAERSPGKDTTTGHWEIAGLTLTTAFPTYPAGFPQSLVSEFERLIGSKTIGNYPASGTEILKELGDEHVRTGYPIVYTSADSVFQIAAHEAVIPVPRLYEMCEIARALLRDEHAVGRVIARPFTGSSGAYQRTPRRHDYSLPPPGQIMPERLSAGGVPVIAIGKISDIYGGAGISEKISTSENNDGIDRTIESMKRRDDCLIFTNLVDFDMLYGHRNDVQGYAEALRQFDLRLPEILSGLEEGDLLIITADHGCDPTTPGTDHTREYIPVLAHGKRVKAGVNLGTLPTFGDIGVTVCDYFGVPHQLNGQSFLPQLLG